MTDDLSRELDDVASSVPAIPNDYAYLQSLIQSLPSPLSPELRSAAVGVLATLSPDAGAAGMAASMIGGAPGTESGAGIGIVSELFYGAANYLSNPLLEDWVHPVPDLLEASWVEFIANWFGKYVVTSGAAPRAPSASQMSSRTNSNENPFNSALAYLRTRASAAGPTAYTTFLNGGTWQSDNNPGLPFLVAAVKFTMEGQTPRAHVSTWRARVEITNAASTPTVLAAGEWFNCLAYSGTWSIHRVTAALAKPAGGWWAGTSQYNWRLRVEYATNAAWSGTGGEVDQEYLLFGEPVLSLSSTQSPPPFSPMIAKWMPNRLYVRGPDGIGAIKIENYAYDSTGPKIKFGTGGTFDAQLGRLSDSVLKIDNADGSSADQGLAIGDDSILFDVDQVNKLGIKGQNDATAGGFVFGSGKDVNLYRDSANVLKTDDSLVVAGTLIAQPSTAQTLAAGTAIVANANIVQIDSSGNVTITAAPTIANGVDGQLVTIVNVDTADTITLQDQGTLASSNLRLAATTVALAPRQSLQLMYSSAIGDWIQIAPKVNVL